MDKVRRYAVYLLVIAGCGGLLFDFGGTIIGPALPYIGPVDENPGSLGLFTTSQVAHLSSAVVMCAALACLAAGWLAEKFGRKFMMLASAAVAALACLPICMTGGNYGMFFVGRAMQGVAAGLIGVVVPMYLAECLDANSRGKGAGMFQLLDFVGITFCSLVGLVVVHTIGAADDASVSAASKSLAWKTIFWSSAVPAVLFFLGALGLRESPRWLYRRGRKDEALAALAANNGEAKAKEILAEMIAADEAEAAEKAALAAAAKGDSIFQRKYVLPFCISLAILICNQAIGFNAIQYFSIPMFMKAGLSQATSNAANLVVWLVPIPVTVVALWLVDRSGRKTLLKAGTLGMVAALVGVATMFLLLEKGTVSTGPFAGWATVAGIALFGAASAPMAWRLRSSPTRWSPLPLRMRSCPGRRRAATRSCSTRSRSSRSSTFSRRPTCCPRRRARRSRRSNAPSPEMPSAKYQTVRFEPRLGHVELCQGQICLRRRACRRL